MNNFNKRLNNELIGLAERLNLDREKVVKKGIEMLEKGGYKYA